MAVFSLSGIIEVQERNFAVLDKNPIHWNESY